jgi:ABC-type sugar transport system ATPase subunit
MRDHRLLEVRALAKSFFGTVVLREVDFCVDIGEAVAIVGPNGAGKSTLLRCIVGAEVADAGTVRCEGVELEESDPAVRAAIATLLDDMDFFPDLSVVVRRGCRRA